MSNGEKKLIFSVYKCFEAEANRGHLNFNINNFRKRALDALGIGNSTLYHVVNGFERPPDSVNSGLKRGRKEKLDDFQREIISRAAYGYFRRNEMMTLKNFENF